MDKRVALRFLKSLKLKAEADARYAGWHNNNVPGVGQTVAYLSADWDLVNKLRELVEYLEGKE